MTTLDLNSTVAAAALNPLSTSLTTAPPLIPTPLSGGSSFTPSVPPAVATSPYSAAVAPPVSSTTPQSTIGQVPLFQMPTTTPLPSSSLPSQTTQVFQASQLFTPQTQTPSGTGAPQQPTVPQPLADVTSGSSQPAQQINVNTTITATPSPLLMDITAGATPAAAKPSLVPDSSSTGGPTLTFNSAPLPPTSNPQVQT